jgi:hypothetical protein
MEFMAARKNPLRRVLGFVKRKPEAEIATIDPLQMAKKTVQDLVDVRAKIKPLEKREKELTTTIKLWGLDVYPGYTAAIEVYKQPGEGFDTDKFKAENPEIHAKYVIDKPQIKARVVPLVRG